MPRSIPSEISAALANTSFRLATLVLIVKPDGTTVSFTDWDIAIQTDLDGNGVLNYSPAQFAGISDFAAQINAPIDDGEVSIVIEDSIFTADDLRRGVYDNSLVYVGYVIPDDGTVSPTSLDSPWLHRKYDLGEIKVDGVRATLELLGVEKRLEQSISRTLSANCPWVFGSPECGINIEPTTWVEGTDYAIGTLVRPTGWTGLYLVRAENGGTSALESPSAEPRFVETLGATLVDGSITWETVYAFTVTGTVSAVTDRKTFSATGTVPVNDQAGEGKLVWTSGDNIGQRHRVRSDNGAGALVVHLPTYFDIQIGDTFDITTGCRHRLTEDCVGKFENETYSSSETLRFGGFPYLADERVTMSAPKRSAGSGGGGGGGKGQE